MFDKETNTLLFSEQDQQMFGFEAAYPLHDALDLVFDAYQTLQLQLEKTTQMIMAGDRGSATERQKIKPMGRTYNIVLWYAEVVLVAEAITEVRRAA